MTSIVIRNARLRFNDLFYAKEYKQGDGKPRWSISLLIEPGSENDKLIRAEIAALAKEAWGTKSEAFLRQCEGVSQKHCYVDGATKAYDGCDGMMFLAAHRYARLKSGAPNTAPAVIGMSKEVLTAESGIPYNGCIVNARIEPWVQTGENPGVRCGFSVVQFAAHGEEFASGAPNIDEFDDLTEGADALV